MTVLQRQFNGLICMVLIGITIIYGLINTMNVNMGNIINNLHVHVKDEVNTAQSLPKCEIENLNLVSDFYDYLANYTYKCQKNLMLGGYIKRKVTVGTKFLCVDGAFKLSSGQCNVVAFSLTNDWSFSDDVDELNCKMYLFSPGMGRYSHTRSSNIQFYNLGISDKKETVKYRNMDTKRERYKDLLKIAEIEDKTIDYLSMELGGTDLAVFEDIFTSSQSLIENIKQIGLEIHTGIFKGKNEIVGETFKKYWNLFKRLECYGFQLTYSKKNKISSYLFKWKGKQRSAYYDVVFVKTS